MKFNLRIEIKNFYLASIIISIINQSSQGCLRTKLTAQDLVIKKASQLRLALNI
mgnify:CR=1 FL=1